MLPASGLRAIPQCSGRCECRSRARDVAGHRARRQQWRLARHAGSKQQSRHRDKHRVGGRVVAIRSRQSEGTYGRDDQSGMMPEYFATIEIARAMRLDPYVGRVEQIVESPSPVGGFHVERDALLAEVAHREIQAGVTLKRWNATRRRSARRLDADDFSAEV